MEKKILCSHPVDKSKSAVVIMVNIPLELLAEKIRESSNSRKIIRLCAEQLKNEVISNIDVNTSGYICDENVIDKSLENIEILPTWLYFFQILLTNKKSFSDTKLRRAKVLFTDICYVMKGVHSPKHIALAQTIHHLTRSKHIINILFKLGYCVSYTDLLDLDELLIKKIIYEQDCNAVRRPTNIVNDSSLFLHGAIDNNDFLEETLSGKNTTHVTAMILYQKQSTRSKNQVQLVRKQEVVNINSESLSS